MEWLWILIPLVAIIGGMLLEYQKNKMKLMELGHQNEEGVEDLRKYVEKLKTRIENLEAIAAGETEEFKTGAGRGIKEIEVTESDAKEESRQHVSKIANNLRSE